MGSSGCIAAGLLGLNLLTMASFGYDKLRSRSGSRRGRRRVSEARLLLLSAIGGSPGAWIGSRLFRHKTRKQPFASHLRIIIAVHCLASAGCMAWLAIRAGQP